MIPLPLNISCSWGFNQPYHPSVVYKEDGLFGHRYWLAQTPYPIADRAPYRDRYELPAVYYSDDGINWLPISDTPLDDLTELEIRDGCYFSDPHLIIKDKQLELFYRFTSPDKIIVLYKRISTNGFVWSERELVLDMHSEGTIAKFGNDIISPALRWSMEIGYECWYVDDNYNNKNRRIRYIRSVDGHTWSDSIVCHINNNDVAPWHIDIQFIEGKHNLITYDVDNERIDWFEGDRYNEFHWLTKIIEPSQRRGDFYEKGLYRACLIKTKSVYNIYFSAHNKQNSYIGLIQTGDKKNFYIVSGGNYISTLKYTIYVHYKTTRGFFRKLFKGY